MPEKSDYSAAEAAEREVDEILWISSWKLALRLISQIKMPLKRQKERKKCRYLRN